MGRNGPRILLIGGTYRAVTVLERLLERGERVVAFIGVEGGGERDFCPEILELCDRAGIPARSGHKLGEEMVRWLEDRIRPELAIALGVHTEIPLSIGGNCRLGLVELGDSAAPRPAVVLRQRGQELVRRELPPPDPVMDPGDAYVHMLDELCCCLEEFLDCHAQPRAERSFSIPFESTSAPPAGLGALAARSAPGSATAALERRVAEYLGAERVVAVESPRAGFRALLAAYGLAKGDEVVVPGVASAAVVDALRARELVPLFADVHPDRLTLAAASAAAALGPRARALVIAHPLGQPAELDSLYALAEERGLEVIEDGCESLGARFGDSRLGRSPCATVFRLPLAVHAPGFELAFVTASAGLAKELEPLGAADRVPDELARLGLEALDRWEDRVAARRRIASAYSAEFSRYDAFRVPPTPEDALSTYSGYLLRLTRFARAAADDLAKLLAESGIETRRLKLPLCERELSSLPSAEHARATGILLPSDESLTDSQRDRVMDEIFGYAIG